MTAPPPAGEASVTITAITHRGAVRASNQDALAIGALTAAEVDMEDPVRVTLALRRPVVAVVADGLGGHAAGEVAAALAARRLAAAAHLLTGEDAVDRLLKDVNDELYRVAAADPIRVGTGATIVGVVMALDGTLWFNVGDARLYREHGGYLGQVSIDDSPRLVEAEPGAELTPSTIVTQSLGGAATPTPIEPHIGLEGGPPVGRWLLCSDGLSDLVPVPTMERILADAADDLRAVEGLRAAAMHASGKDNISIALISADRRSQTRA
jgi:serine/threonine protein phosphatase PrpC